MHEGKSSEDFVINDPSDEWVSLILATARRQFGSEVELSAAYDTRSKECTVTFKSGRKAGRVAIMMAGGISPDDGHTLYHFRKHDDSPV